MIVQDLWRDIIAYVPLADLRDLSAASPLFDKMINEMGIKVIYDSNSMSSKNGVINLNAIKNMRIDNIIVVRFETGPLKIFARVRSYKVGRFITGSSTEDEEIPVKESYRNVTDYHPMNNNIPNSIPAKIWAYGIRDLMRFYLWDPINNVLLAPANDSFDIVYRGAENDVPCHYGKMAAKKYTSGLIEYIDFDSKCTVTKIIGFSRTYVIGHFKILFKDDKWVAQ